MKVLSSCFLIFGFFSLVACGGGAESTAANPLKAVDFELPAAIPSVPDQAAN